MIRPNDTKKRIPQETSIGEATMALHFRAHGLTPEREYLFWPKRKFRFDFAWPDRMIALEVEGGSWTDGRHSRGSGFESDCTKYSEAAVRGWRVIRVTTGMVTRGEAIEFALRALA